MKILQHQAGCKELWWQELGPVAESQLPAQIQGHHRCAPGRGGIAQPWGKVPHFRFCLGHRLAVSLGHASSPSQPRFFLCKVRITIVLASEGPQPILINKNSQGLLLPGPRRDGQLETISKPGCGCVLVKLYSWAQQFKFHTISHVKNNIVLIFSVT